MRITIDDMEAVRNNDNVIVVDVRDKEEYLSGSVPGARNFSVQRLSNNSHNLLRKDKSYYLICKSGKRSKETYKFLQYEGYNVFDVKGGIKKYSKKYSLEIPKSRK